MTQSQLRDEASENLRVIRTLLERSTHYEAMSASTALFAGSIALAVSVVLFTMQPGPVGFVATWAGVLAAVGVFNTVQLALSARRRGEPLFSPGLRHTLRAVAPPLAAGAFLGTLFALVFGDLPAGAGFWSLFYGLALLALGGVAPRSLRFLGGFVFLAGIATLGLVFLADLPAAGPEHLVMGLAFGTAHFVYGLIASAHATPSPPAPDPARADTTSSSPQPTPRDADTAEETAASPPRHADTTPEDPPPVQTGFVPARTPAELRPPHSPEDPDPPRP